MILKPWEQNWELLNSESKSGGQGTTKIVHRKGDDLYKPHVLKILNRQKDADRRRRFYREVTSLLTLDHRGVPKLYESNAELFANLDVDLYFVQEYIKGDTLEDFIAKTPIQFQDSFKLLNSLLDILEHCHRQDIYHRDIKPDNVILRCNNIEDPVLIDFGQSFNTETDELSTITFEGQIIGNRFLMLPEFTSPSSNRKDPRSDITVCCGIFFFVLTGLRPVTLLDDKSRPPHQQDAPKDKLIALHGINTRKLFALFDQAFDVHIDYRFQSIDSLRASLSGISLSRSNNMNTGNETITDRIVRIRNTIISSTDQRRLSLAKNALEHTNKQIDQVLQELLSQLGRDFARLQGGYGIRISELALGNTLGIIHTLSNKKFTPRFTVKVIGTEVLIGVEEKEQLRELIRVPLSATEFGEEHKAIIKEFFITNLESILDE